MSHYRTNRLLISAGFFNDLLEELRFSVEDVLAQDGTIYKRSQLEKVLEAIKHFYAATGVKLDYGKWLRKLEEGVRVSFD